MDQINPSIVKSPSVFGGACIIACICVGAGMLGLPAAGAGVWTIGALASLFITMLLMILSGCLFLEVLQFYPYKSSFSSVTKDLLGAKFTMVNNLMIYFVGGILLYAYITSSGYVIAEYTGINPKFAAILFVIFFSLPILHSTKMVDRFSIILILFMIFSFLFGVVGLWSNIEITALLRDTQSNNINYLWGFLPITLAAFGYHHSISTMRDYYLDEKLAQKAIVVGVSMAFIIYAIWLLSIYGNIPREQFGPIIAQGGNIDALLISLRSTLAKENLSNIISAFSAAAILSSFIGVGLGLLDFLADLFGHNSTSQGRFKTWVMTFLPPLIFSVILPFGFLTAIGYAAAAAAFWACLTPALLVRKTRLTQPKSTNEEPKDRIYRAPGGDWGVIVVSVFGMSVITIHLLSMLGVLPEFS
ncbi:aromatic amino acid transporter [Vibrio sp. 16]|uniref:aromatic amino acid transporter n=1 Tax=Vibrio sp. 16 TaxID=391586 RepID=UPI000312E2C9|nr:aromatic amino acid transporter [Vibrio sp. 16]CAK4076561.1 Tryptophan-specific transport protein [Vibrio sp. 16]